MTERIQAQYLLRIQVHWPIRTVGSEKRPPIEAETEDVSSDGFSLRAKASGFNVNEEIECLLFIPTFHPEVPNENLILRCNARVIDIGSPDADGVVLINCRIERYSVDHRLGGRS
jgi:hypothetical protein